MVFTCVEMNEEIKLHLIRKLIMETIRTRRSRTYIRLLLLMKSVLNCEKRLFDHIIVSCLLN